MRVSSDGLRAGLRAVKVLLIDNHVLVRSALKLLIESHHGLSVNGAAGDCAAAGGLIGRERPDVVLFNIEPGEECRLACVAELKASSAGARVLITSDIGRPEFFAECLRAGASGVVAKEADPEVLFKAIRRVHAGELWFERSTVGAVLSAMAREGARRRDPEEVMIASLTARELEVIGLVGEGLRNRQIAARLFVSETTVRHHLTSIFTKLDLTDRLALLIFAYRHGLASLPGHTRRVQS